MMTIFKSFIKKSAAQLFIILQLLWLQVPCFGSDNGLDPAIFHQSDHVFLSINTYEAVSIQIQQLLDKNIPPEDILVLTDWDDTINGPGAWLQKDYQGQYFYETKRFLQEHEVDQTLRDPKTLIILNNILLQNIPIIVTTARPPVIDSHLNEQAKTDFNIPNLLDLRHDHDPHAIDYDSIQMHIKKMINNYHEDTLKEKVKHKVTRMEQMSGVSLTAQPQLDPSTHILLVNESRIVYHNGYGFVGHNKGCHTFEMLKALGKFAPHIIIIDDSVRSLKSYYTVLDKFKEIGSKLYILHYPTGK